MKKKSLLSFIEQRSLGKRLSVTMTRMLVIPLLFLLFFAGGITNLQAQTGNIVPAANPATVVKMGDSLTFTVGVSTSAAVTGTTLEVTMPADGFEILPSTPNIVAGGLAPDRKSVVLNSGALNTSNKTMTIYVKAFCEAEDEPLATRVISYDLKTSGGVSLKTATTASIANFNNPIINVPVIAPMNVNLGQVNTRIIQVTQTAPNSHLKNMKVNVTADKTGITISKIEISSTGTGGWVDVTASALITTPATGYTYLFNRANAFGPAPALNYAGAKLSTGQSFYIRETYTLTKCASGNMSYGFEYGDGTTFCGVTTTAASNAAVVVPGYALDYVRTANTLPGAYNTEGFMAGRIENNSTTANLTNVFTTVYTSDYANRNMHVFQYALLMNGTTVVDTIPMVNNTAISGATALGGASGNMPAHANTWKVVLDSLNNPAKTAAYIAAGLSDLDGDGRYSDITPGKSVTIRYYYKLQFLPALFNCIASIPSTIMTSRAYFTNVCNELCVFTRGYNASSSTEWEIVEGGFQKPNISIASPMLAPGDPTTLTIEPMPLGSPTAGWPFTYTAATAAQREHRVEVTLPVGLTYPGGTIVIRAGAYTVNATEVTFSGGVLTFRNPERTQTFPLYYDIPVQATATVDPTKDLRIEHTFKMAGDPTPPIHFSCYDLLVPYIQKTACTRLEMANYTAERTNFGWVATDPLSRDTTTRATRTSPGINLQAVGPYDNITFTSDINVNSNISLAANENVMVELNYQLASTATYFNMPTTDASRKIVLFYDQGGSGTFIQVAEFKTGGTNSGLITTVNTNPDHRVAINIASFIGAGKAIPALTSGDKLKVVFYLQTTTSVPIVPTDVAVNAEVYTQIGTGAKNVCYPLLQSLTLFNYNLTNSGSSSTDFPNLNVTHNNGTFLRWQIGNGAGTTSEVFTNEYRPNVFYKDIVLTVNALIDIHSLFMTANSASQPLVHFVAGTDYVVTYNNGKTIITFLSNPLMEEGYLNYFRGVWIYGAYDVICAPDLESIVVDNTKQRLNYPTSATTIGYVSQNGSGNLFAANSLTSAKKYGYQLATSQATVSPAGREAQWNFTLTNNSNWASTDPMLPNSWLAFECDPGVVPTELRDVTNGVVLANASQFVNYAPNKYWVKLGNLTLPASRNYSVKCTYTTCTGTPGLNVIYGMNKVAYPDDPAAGFLTTYNSPGYFCNTTNLNLKLTPPTVDFGGTLVHTTNEAGGMNRFCDSVVFTATYINGTWAEVSNMRLNVQLLAEGMNYTGTLPQVRLGNGTTWGPWQSVKGASQSTGHFEIVVGDSVTLAGVGLATYQAQVRFSLHLSCGMENSIPVYADFTGESGCGAPTTKKYNSGLIKIAGLTDPNLYWINDLVLVQTPYTGGTSNGEMTLTGKYTSTAPTQPGEIAVINLPANLQMVGQSGTPMFFEQKGQRLSAPFVHSATANKDYTFNITLRPTNPETWNMDTTYIYVTSGVVDSLFCDGARCALISYSDEIDSVSVSMKKLDICFDPGVTITSESQYNDPTSERIIIEGALRNFGDITSGRIAIDLYTFDGIDYVPVNNVISGSVLSAVPSYGNANFRIVANIQNIENMCNLILMLRRDNTTSGAVNPYLATDTCIMSVPVPFYNITATVDPVCQMDAGVVIGELPIADYQYKWTPATHLNRDNISRPTFSYDYINYPVANDTVLQYLLTVTRPGGCSTVDTVFVPLKGLPSVANVADMTLCNDGNLSVTFTDPTGSGTIFSWAITNGPSVGLPASGTTPTISGKVRNTGNQPIILQIQVTPKKNGCDGVTKMFFVTVNPKPQINYVINQSYCSGQVVPAQVLTGNLSSAIYRWQHVSGTSVMTATSGINVIPGFIASNTTGATRTGTYRAFAEYDNAGVICYSDTMTFTISIDPSPVVNSVVDQHICNGGNLNITFAGTPSTNIYYWQKVSGATIPGLANNGTGNISVTGIANTTPSPFVAVYKVTPTNTGGTCIGIEGTFTITVYPTPTLSSPATAAPICSGTVFNYTATSTTNGLTYGWRRLANAGISNPVTTGSTAGINEVLTNTTQAPVTVQYEYTMTQNTYCAAVETISVVVNPVVDFGLTNSALSLCSGTASSVNLGYVTTNTLANLRYEIIFSDAARGAGFTNVAYTTPPASNLPIAVPATVPAGVYNGVVHVRFNSAGAENCMKAYPFEITIVETPRLTSDPNITLCSGETFSYNITSSVVGTSYSWGRLAFPSLNSGTPKTGTGALINETLTLAPTVGAPFTFKGYVRMTANGCTYTDSIAVTVNPKATLTNIPVAADLSICTGETFTYTTPTTNITPASAVTITWERYDAAGIDEPGTTGTGSISEVLTNTTGSAIVVTYEFTMNAYGCENRQLVRVTVAPGPVLSTPLYAGAICSGSTFNYTARSLTKNVTFSWTRNALPSGVTGTAASGTTDRITDILTSTSSAPQVVSYDIKMTLADGCENTETIEVTVNPKPTLTSDLTNDAICSGQDYMYMIESATSGVSYIWRRTAVAGITPNQNFGVVPYINETLTNSTTAPITVTYTISAEANGCTTTGITKNVVVNPSPTVAITNVSPMLMNVGGIDTLRATSATGVAALTTWTSSDPAIVSVSGTGLKTAITANGQGTAVITVTVTNVSGCTGTASIVVNVEAAPTATLGLATGAPTEICNGGVTMLNVIITGGVAPFEIIYTNGVKQDTVIALSTPWTFYVTPPTNAGTSQSTVTYTPVSVKYGSGISISSSGSAVVTVNPTATVNPAPTNIEVCHGATVTGIMFNTTTTPTDRVSYEWTNTNPNIGLAMSGQTLVPAFHAVNMIGVQDSAIITVTPYYRGLERCPGTPSSYTIKVNPQAEFSVIQPAAICEGDSALFTTAANIVGLTPVSSTVKFYYDKGCASEITGYVKPTTTTTYYVKATTDKSCPSQVQEITLEVKPLAHLTSATSDVICSGERFEYTATSTIVGVSYTWSRAAVAGIDNAAKPSTAGSTIRENLINLTTAPIDVIYEITMTANGCANTEEVTVTVNPIVDLELTTSRYSSCSNESNITLAYTAGNAGLMEYMVVFSDLAKGVGFTNTTTYATVPAPASGIVIPLPANAIAGVYSGTLKVRYSAHNDCEREYPFEISVVLQPELQPILDQSHCHGTMVPATEFRGNSTNGLIIWTRQATSDPILGLADMGSSSMPQFRATNNGTTDLVAIYDVVMTMTDGVSVCVDSSEFKIAIEPAQIVIGIDEIAVCVGDSIIVEFTGTAASYEWTRVSGSSALGIPQSGTGDIRVESTNTTTKVLSATYRVTPVSSTGLCRGDFDEFTIIVYPSPVLIGSSVPAICSEENFSYIARSSTPDIAYSWTRVASAGINSGAVSSGMDNEINETLVNTTNAPIAVEYIITMDQNGVCSQDTSIFVTVNPKPTFRLTKNIYAACYEDATIDLVYNEGDAFAKEYEIIFSEEAQNAGFVDVATTTLGSDITITLPVARIEGSYTGVVRMLYAGTTECVKEESFTIVLNPELIIYPVPVPPAYCAGVTVPEITIPVNVSSSAARIHWALTNGVNIGLSATSGYNKIPSFLAVNNTTSALTAEFEVTLTYTNAGITCTAVDSFSITVNPNTVLDNIFADYSLCTGMQTDTITFTGVASEFRWEAVGHDIGIPMGPQTGNFGRYTVTNTGASVLSATITVTPVYDSIVTCVGASKSFTISVEPIPTIYPMEDRTFCEGWTLPIPLVGDVPGTVYKWIGGAAIGLADGQGSIEIPSFRATAGTATIKVVPNKIGTGLCGGDTTEFVITINATAVLDNTSPMSICSGGAVNYTLTSVAATSITWEREPNTGINEVPTSGTGNIVDTLTNNTNGLVHVRYVVTLNTGWCTNTEYITVTVSPRIDISNTFGGMTATACSEGEFATTLESNVYGTTFTWARLANANVQEAVSNGTTAEIREVLTNLTNTPVSVRYAVVATANGCTKEDTLVVTLNPQLTLTSPTGIAALCSGEELIYGITSAPATGVSYTWARLFNANVMPHSAQGTGSHISETIYNDTNTDQVITYVITMELNGCQDTAMVFGVIKPLPEATLSTSAVTMALGSQMNVAITSGANAGSTVVSLDPAIVGAALNGSRDAIVLNALAEGTTTVTYSVTENGCTSIYELTVTVSRTPIGTLTLLGDNVLCSGGSTILEIATIQHGVAPWTVVLTNTASPAWSQTVTVNSSSELPKKVNITLPTNAGPGVAAYSYSIDSITDANGAVGTTHSGYIKIEVLPVPKVDPVPANQVLCNNTMSDAVYFQGVATVYNWVVDRNIGLQLAGSDNIASFKAINTTNASITATVTVTPEYRYKDKVCTGTASTFTITVHPTVTMHAVADTTVCADEDVTIVLSGATNYRWDAVPAIGLPAGTGTAIIFKAKNNTQDIISKEVVVTPIDTHSGMDCDGNTMSFMITVNPVPEVSQIADRTHCDGEQVPVYAFNSNNRNATYVWARTGGVSIVGIPENGINEMPAFKAVNKGTTVIEAEYSVVAYYGIKGDGAVCESDTVKFMLRIYPELKVPAIPAQEYCPGLNTDSIALKQGTSSDITYYWTQVSGPYIGLNPSAGKDTIPSFVTVNNSHTHAATAVIEVIASRPGGYCNSQPYQFEITIHPTPVLPHLFISGDTILSIGEQTTLVIETQVNGIFQWYADPTRLDFIQDGRHFTTPILDVTTSYYITMINDGGCESENHAKVTVHVGEHDLFIPEAITPNGDGYNDTWVIKNIDNFPKNHVTIVNRWGVKVYEKSGYSNNNPWDCYPSGNMVLGGGLVPRGTYFYQIVLNDGTGRIYKGFIEVVY